MEQERRTIYYSGRVQGVGFRWRALASIEGAAVDGYITNLPDGRVELVLEGEPDHTAAAAECVRRALARHLSAEEEFIGPATGEFRGMRVRR